MPRLINPSGLHDPVPYGYSHIASANNAELVLIAGQYGSDVSGHVVSKEFAEQVRQSFTNLAIALQAVGLGFEHVLQIRTFVVDHDPDKH